MSSEHIIFAEKATQVLLNAVTVHMGSGTQVTGKLTNQDLKRFGAFGSWFIRNHEESGARSDRATIDSRLTALAKCGLWEWTKNAATK